MRWPCAEECIGVDRSGLGEMTGGRLDALRIPLFASKGRAQKFLARSGERRGPEEDPGRLVSPVVDPGVDFEEEDSSEASVLFRRSADF